MKSEYIESVRSFNRFYTNIIGLLDTHILDSEYSLIEARILFELYDSEGLLASDITSLINIDKGYLSRLLKNFEARHLIVKVPSKDDKRASMLALSRKGKKEYEILNAASDKQTEALFKNLSDSESLQLAEKISEIQILIKKGIGNGKDK